MSQDSASRTPRHRVMNHRNVAQLQEQMASRQQEDGTVSDPIVEMLIAVSHRLAVIGCWLEMLVDEWQSGDKSGAGRPEP